MTHRSFPAHLLQRAIAVQGAIEGDRRRSSEVMEMGAGIARNFSRQGDGA
jgi:hypothetical protein